MIIPSEFRKIFNLIFALVLIFGTTLMGNPFHIPGELPGNLVNLIPSVSGPDTVCANTTGSVYSTEPGMLNYIWTVSSGGAITSGAGTSSIVVMWSQVGTGSVTVTYTTASSPGSLSVVVFPNLTPSVSISSSANPVCAGASVTFAATFTNGGTFPSFQWKVNGVNAGTNSTIFTMIPVNGDQVGCEMMSNGFCLTSNPVSSNTILMTVGASQAVDVTVTASANPVCQGSAVNFTATPINGGAFPQYAWKVNGIQTGVNAGNFSYVPANGDIVTCQLTSSVSCATGNPATSIPVAITVHPIVASSVTIQSSSTVTCQGLPVTFTANAVNGGSAPFYQWSLNGFAVGANGPTYSFVPANGDAVLCKLYSSEPCVSVNPAVSNTIIMTVNPNLPVSVSISSSANPLCVNSSVTLTALSYNGGSNPVFVWKVNGAVAGTNSATYSYVPQHGDQVICMMTSNAVCVPTAPVVSNTIIMSVSPMVPVSVAIVSSMNPVCQNVQVVFNATATNSGTTPIYQWKVNGINQGVNNPVFTIIPQNGDVVTCTLTSSASCALGNPATSNPISMSVIPSLGMPVSVVVTPSSNPSCIGQNVTYNASATNGGSSPVYAWTVNGLNVGSNSPVFNFVPSNGDFIRCMVTSDLSCATNNPALSDVITMAVNPILPVSVSVSGSANPSCVGATVTYTANAVNPGTSPVYQWKVNGVNAGLNQNTFLYAPTAGEVIKCEVTSSIGCSTGNPASSNSITAIVQPIIPVGISISTLTNPSCAGTQVFFQATITNGGTSPAYQWKLNGNNTGSNSAVLAFTPVSGDVITCRLTSNALCYSGNKVVTSNAIVMTVSAELAPSVAISASSNPYCEGVPVTFSAIPTNGGTMPSYQWQVNCQNTGTTNSTFTYTPSNEDFITCKLTSNLSCAVLNPCKSNGITMNLNSGTVAGIEISASANPVCTGSNVSFNAVAINGGSAPGFQWKVNGSNAGTNSSFFNFYPSNGDVVTCQLSSNAACVSGSPVLSAPTVMSLSSGLPVTVSISTPTNPFCLGTAVNFVAVPANGGASPIYQWKQNGISSGSNSPFFTSYPQSGDIISCELLSNSSCASGPNPAVSNAINLQSIATIPVSVSISASTNPVCSGASAGFTAVVSGGGNNPAFLWLVNGIPAAGSLQTFNYIPLDGDVVVCQLTSSLVCGSPSVAFSNSITMNVTPALPASAFITVSENPCCLGSEVTFNAAVTNGGASPVYQWVVNCLNVGTNSSVFTYIPTNGDVVLCKIIPDGLCLPDHSVVSNNINMAVIPVNPVNVVIQPSMNPFCVGSLVTFTASPSNGGSAPVYQWQVNHTAVGINSNTYTYAPVDGDSVACFLTSNASCISGNPAASNTLGMTGISALPVTISIDASNNPICFGTLVAFTATITNGGTSPDYQWKVNGINAGPNHHTYQYPPAIGDVISCELETSLSCATPNPAVSNLYNMTVYPQMPVTVIAVASQNPTCQNTPVTFTATVNNGGTAPLYRWRVNGAIAGSNSPTYSYNPVNGDVIYCRVTSNVLCATGNPSNSNQITMSVSPTTPAAISISPSMNPVCEGAQVTLNAMVVNGGTAPVYQWKLNGFAAGTNSAQFSYIPANGDVVQCDLISNSMCTAILNATSNVVNMTVSAIQQIGVSVVPAVNPVCINNFVTFTANPLNGGATPQYQWKVNGSVVGTNSQSYTYMPVHDDNVTCTMTSGLLCTTENPVTSTPVVMNVATSLPVSVTVFSTPQPSCQGQFVNCTANQVNGGFNPLFQWMVNGINVGTNSDTYNYSPSQGDQLQCQVTSDFTCASGNPAISESLIIEVNPILPTAVSIVSSGNPVCIGAMVTFTATPANGGNIPLYQWKVNGANVGLNAAVFSYIPTNGDTVTCLLTSGIACPANSPVSSNEIIMNVAEPMSMTVSVSASQNPTCQGSTIMFQANAGNAGYNPTYQWKVNSQNAGTGLATFSYAPVNGDVVLCEVTSSGSCVVVSTVQSEPVVMVVSTELPVSVVIQPSQNPVCSGQSVVFSSSVVNGGTSPTYLWMVNGVNVGTSIPDFTYTPSNGDTISCMVVSDFSCATGNPAMSNEIIMSVGSSLGAGITISASANPVCEGNPVTFTAAFTNAGQTPVFQWKVNNNNVGLNQPFFTYTPQNGDVVLCQITPNDPCASALPVQSNQIVLTVSANLVVSVSISASANQICEGTLVVYTAVPENGGSSPSFQWKVNGIQVGTNNMVFSYNPVDGDQVQCYVTSGLSCAVGNPAGSNVILMNVYVSQNVLVTVSATPTGPVCEGTSVELQANTSNGGSNPTYQWFKNGTIVGTNQPTYNFVPVNNDQVYAVLTSNLMCATGNPAVSDTLTMVVEESLLVSVSIEASQNNVCAGTTVSYTATSINGGFPIYHWYVNGTSVGLNQPTFAYNPSDGDEVYAVMISSLNCVNVQSTNSNVIKMVVNPALTIGVDLVSDTNHVCHGTVVTFSATPLNGGVPDYQWYLNDFPVGTNHQTFSYIPDDGDVIQVEMTTSLSCVTASSVFSDTIMMFVDTPLSVDVTASADQLTVCAGTEILFTAQGVNGGNPQYQWYRNEKPAGVDDQHFSCVPVNGDRIYVTMTSTLSCVVSPAATSNLITMVVKPFPGAATAIEGPESLCSGTTGIVYEISPIADATSYAWIVPPGVTIEAGAGDNRVTLNFGEFSGSGVILASGANGCGIGLVSPDKNVDVFPVPETPLVSRVENALVSSSMIGTQWYFEGALIQDSTGQTLSPSEPGWYWCLVYENGCTSDTSRHYYFDGIFPGPVTSDPGFWVYPVPNDGHFTVAISLPAEDVFNITIFNSLGVQLFEMQDIVVKNKFKDVIDLRPLIAKGLITVVFKCDDYEVVKKVLVYR